MYLLSNTSSVNLLNLSDRPDHEKSISSPRHGNSLELDELSDDESLIETEIDDGDEECVNRRVTNVCICCLSSSPERFSKT
jgi:hypothetical protein